jgi:hypothetical protein
MDITQRIENAAIEFRAAKIKKGYVGEINQQVVNLADEIALKHDVRPEYFKKVLCVGIKANDKRNW